MNKEEYAAAKRQARRIGIDRRANLDMRFYGTSNTKRQRLYQEFGYPTELTFDDYYRMYRRNAVARAAIKRIMDNCWQDLPEIFEGDEDEKATELTAWDKNTNKVFKKLWKAIKGADRRNLVGNYSALLIQLKDGGKWDEPVNRDVVRKAQEKAIVRLIPVWEAQLDVSQWDDDPQSATFGMPKMYSFSEIPVGEEISGRPQRIIEVHPERVFILAEGADDDGLEGESVLEAGFNKLLDIEKISGGSAEGFLKNASRQLKFNFSKDTNFAKMAKALGVSESEIADAMSEQTRNLNNSTDSAVIMQEGDAGVLAVAPGDPEPSWRTALNEFCATLPVPVKILIGMQTGERASTEDGKDWAKTGNARRGGFLAEMIEGLVRWFIGLEILPAPESDEITIHWSDLLAPSDADKMDSMGKLADVATKTQGAFGRSAISENEIREAGGYEPDPELDKKLPPSPPGNPLKDEKTTPTDATGAKK